MISVKSSSNSTNANNNTNNNNSKSLMTQSISKPSSNNSSSSSSSSSSGSGSGSSNSSMETKKASIIAYGTNNNTNTSTTYGGQQTNLTNGGHNGFYKQSQRSNSNLNEKSRKNSGNGSSRNFKSRSNNNNGGDNEFIMLQRPTILAKPPANTVESEATKILKNESSNNEVIIVAAGGGGGGVGTTMSETNNIIKGSQYTRARETTPESKSQKLVTNSGESILSNGKIQKTTINFVNLLNKTAATTTTINGSEVASSNSNILVNNNNKLKVKRELVTPLINNQKENSLLQPQPTLSQHHFQQQQQQVNASSSQNQTSSASQQMPNPVIMTSAVRLLDDNLQWCDGLQEFLIDQNDFLVIGVLGKRGVGKSTLMSLLVNGGGEGGGSQYVKNNSSKQRSNDVFSKASKDSNELGQHRTSGIQAFVTNERTILLDVQPLLSGSSLEKSINMDKKGGSFSNNDFKYYENFIEIQSIELACFVLSVCNVVLLTEDWFVDPSLFKILHTAEMLMPNISFGLGSAATATTTNNNGSNSASNSDEIYSEHHAHLVYVLNKSEFVNKLDMVKMKATIENLMKGSKLIYKNSLMRDINWLGMSASTRNSSRSGSDSVNFVLIPKIKQDNNHNNNMILDAEDVDTFNGLPSVEKSAKCLTRELLSIKRNVSSQASASVLNNVSGVHVTEKRWFLYANKVWEAIRKSQLINEYNRLMT